MARAAKSPTKAAAPKARSKAAKTKRAGAQAPALAVWDDAKAQAELDVFIDRYTPGVAALGRAALAHMARRLPGAVSLAYDNYNAVAVGFAPAGKAAVMSIALYPRWVNLFFLKGAGLPDPDRLLEGKGSTVRSIRITDAAQLKDPRIDALIATALLSAGWRLDPKARNTLVIQSISPTQRPRRP